MDCSEYEESDKYFKMAIDVDPGNPNLYVRRVILYSQSGKTEAIMPALSM